MRQDDELPRGEAERLRRRRVPQRAHPGDLEEVVPAADRAERALVARAVRRRVPARAKAVLRLRRREPRERLGHAVDLGEAARPALPDPLEHRPRVALGERIVVHRLPGAPLEDVRRHAADRRRDEPHAAAGVAADELRDDPVRKGEGRPDGDAPPGVKVRHAHGAHAAGQRGDARELLDGVALEPDVVAGDEAGVGRKDSAVGGGFHGDLRGRQPRRQTQTQTRMGMPMGMRRRLAASVPARGPPRCRQNASTWCTTHQIK